MAYPVMRLCLDTLCMNLHRLIANIKWHLSDCCMASRSLLKLSLVIVHVIEIWDQQWVETGTAKDKRYSDTNQWFSMQIVELILDTCLIN